MKRFLFLPFSIFTFAQLYSHGLRPTHHNPLLPLLAKDTGRLSSDEEDEEEEEHESHRDKSRRQAAGRHERDAAGQTTNYHISTTETAKQSAAIEQTWFGSRPAPELITSFDGLGEGFQGPQGTAFYRSPSDNALAVGPDHIVQIVNSRMAIFSKKGKRFDSTGRVLYGPGETRNIFRGFGGPCEKMNNGDAVVRYDQLANRWLIVMPTFRRGISRTEEKDSAHGGVPYPPQPGQAVPLYQPGPGYAGEPAPGGTGPRVRTKADSTGTYCMCYAISTGPDPMGPYYRYEFDRPLFPDYPRPTIWPDGYYTTSSTSDNLIQRQAFVVDREKMLKGEPAAEQGFLIDNVNFLLNSDVEGQALPPKGAPNIMITNGGTQLNKQFEDDGIYFWTFHVDWKDTTKTKLEGPIKLAVAPYHYMGDGQLTKAVPQPGTDQRLDSQGDKLLGRLIYRRIGKRESLVVVHSVNTAAGGGGVRWYQFQLGRHRKPALYQQGTYAPGGDYRWLAGATVDRAGNIGIGYSYGSATHFTGQRFTGRLAGDTLGIMSFNENILVEGKGVQTNTLRWEDYTYTVMDPSDDETFWYVGDYMKKDARNYSSKIGAFRLTTTAKK